MKLPFGKKSKATAEPPTRGRGRPAGSVNKGLTMPRRINRMVPSAPIITNGTVTNKNFRDPHKSCKEKQSVTETKLNTLRQNISTLLKMIVPDFTTDSLEGVDDVVTAMITANTGNIQGATGRSQNKESLDVKPEDETEK